MRAPRPTTRRFRPGSRGRAPRERPVAALSRADWRRPYATARTRIRKRPSTPMARRAPASQPRHSTRARRFPTTTSTIPTRHSDWFRSSTRPRVLRSPSSSTPTPAASHVVRALRKPSPGRSTATAHRLSAASWRSTARSTATPPGRSQKSSPRSSSRPKRARRRKRSSPQKGTSGSWLVQDDDVGRVSALDLEVVTKRAPTDAQVADMLFAWTVAKHVKSNAIVYAKAGRTVGIGAGQMSRVDSSTIASLKAHRMAGELGLPESPATGSVVASDAFFPFPDGLLAAAEAGAVAVIQPGGSVRDTEVIVAADEAGLAMIFTGMRHFRH